MYDPNKPLWQATFGEIRDFLQEMGLTNEPVERHPVLSRGLHALCMTLGIDRNKAIQLKDKGVFTGSVFQQVKGGTITFDPEAVIKQYAAYCASQSNI